MDGMKCSDWDGA